MTTKFNLDIYKMESGQVQSYAFPGGYPLFYLAADGGVLCPSCVNENLALTNDPDDKQWHIVGADCNLEDDSLTCDHCSKRIESAYGEDE